MIYEYKSEDGEIIDVEMGMFEEHPKEIVRNSKKFSRSFTPINNFIPTKDRTACKKDLSDFESSKISKGYIKVKSKSGKSFIPAQLVEEKTGEHKLVYKTMPTREIGVKPNNQIIDKLSKNMEKFV